MTLSQRGGLALYLLMLMLIGVALIKDYSLLLVIIFTFLAATGLVKFLDYPK
jgi:hypothetical protein